jgi:hypothetical protein
MEYLNLLQILSNRDDLLERIFLRKYRINIATSTFKVEIDVVIV